MGIPRCSLRHFWLISMVKVPFGGCGHLDVIMHHGHIYYSNMVTVTVTVTRRSENPQFCLFCASTDWPCDKQQACGPSCAHLAPISLIAVPPSRPLATTRLWTRSHGHGHGVFILATPCMYVMPADVVGSWVKHIKPSCLTLKMTSSPLIAFPKASSRFVSSTSTKSQWSYSCLPLPCQTLTRTLFSSALVSSWRSALTCAFRTQVAVSFCFPFATARGIFLLFPRKKSAFSTSKMPLQIWSWAELPKWPTSGGQFEHCWPHSAHARFEFLNFLQRKTRTQWVLLVTFTFRIKSAAQSILKRINSQAHRLHEYTLCSFHTITRLYTKTSLNFSQCTCKHTHWQ